MNRMLIILGAILGTTSLCMAAEQPSVPQAESQPVLVTALSLLPSAKDAPKELQIKSGDTIVAIGDSITAGGGYLRNIDAVLAQQYPDLKIAKVVNKGISGQKAENLIGRFEKDVVSNQPAVVTISIGINDVWHRLKNPPDTNVLNTYKANVAKMVDQAQAAGIKVILLAPTVIQEDPQAEGNKRLPLYVAALQEIAAEKKCQFVDLHGMFLGALEKKPSDLKSTWLTRDGVHMKQVGDAIMAIGVLRALGVPDDKIAATTIQPPAPRPPKPADKPAPKPVEKPTL